MPHGHCYLWKPALVRTMVVSDLLIGLAYVSISTSLYWLVRKIKLPFSAMFIAFGIFILACGATHFMEIYTLWTPNYWASAGVKIVTATASVVTAIYMFPVAPKVMGLAKAVKLSESRGQELQRAYSEMEARVEERTRELGQALAARDEFLSIASHELKTPLSSLVLQLELASSSVDPNGNVPAGQIKKMLEVSERQVDRIGSLIEDLLDVSRIQSGKLALHYETFELTEVAREAYERLTAQFQNAGCSVSLDLQSVVGEWDRSRVDQIFVNLLTNAAKYAAGQPVRITVKPEGGRAVIRIQDAGPGISSEKQSRIFERFERASASRNVGGLGLGLFITKKIVEMHGGTIVVTSEAGRGTTFDVGLPLARKAVA